MITRNERRKIRKSLGKRVIEHPITKRIKRNIHEAGDAATEVYRIHGNTPDEHLYFDVYSMRKWSKDHGQYIVTTICWDRVNRLLENDSIDRDRLFTHTIKNKMDPIIIGAHAAGPNGDQILDGSHRMVAYAMAAASAGLEGLPLPLPAYLLQPNEWQEFVIPNFIAKALQFDKKYED